MTGKERMYACLKGEAADRIPIAFVPMDGYIARANNRELWEFAFTDSDTQYDMQIRYLQRHPENDMLYAWAGKNREPVKDRKVVRKEDGLYLEWLDNGECEPLDRTAAGGIWKPRRSSINIVKPAVSEEEVVRKYINSDDWMPDSDKLSEAETYRNLKRLADNAGKEKYIVFNLSAIIPTTYNCFGGFTEGLIALKENPVLFESVLEKVTYEHAAHIKAASAAGADGAWMSLFNEGSDFLDPAVWRKIIAPYQKKLVDECHKNNLNCHMWLLGDFLPLAKDLAEMQPDSLAPDQERKGYSSDPVSYRKAAGSGICIHGCVSEQDLADDSRISIYNKVMNQSRKMGDSQFIMGTPALTWDMDPMTLDYLCSILSQC